MVSKTKFPIETATIETLFAAAGISPVTNIAPLGAGEFNAVYAATDGQRDYVLKIAPAADAPTMTYEANMMDSEIFWYQQMREKTDIHTPQIFFTDFSHTRIPTAYFIMERLPGKTLDKAALSKEEHTQAAAKTAQMVAQIHKVKNDKFGYRQCGLYDDWYQAIRAMVRSILADGQKKGKRSKRGERLLGYIDQHKDILAAAECCMVNFDIWEPNILCQKENGQLRLSWIDPERGFWGDPIVDFVCLEMMTPYEKKTASIQAYNEISDHPVQVTREETIRYAVAQGYLAVLMQTERYYRYTPHHFGWWRNAAASAWLYKSAFDVLGKG